MTLASIWQNNEGIYAHKGTGLPVLLELTHGAFLYDWCLK